MYLPVSKLYKLYTHIYTREENKRIKCCVGILQVLTLCRHEVGCVF